MGSYKKRSGNAKDTEKARAPEDSTLAAPVGLTIASPSPPILALITFAGALAGYLLTFARTVTLVDSGELILTSARLGVAHPPGFPLYTMMGFLFSKLPIGSIAARISFMSAVFAALAAGALALIAHEVELALRVTASRDEARKKSKTDDESQPSTELALLSQVFSWSMPIAVGWTLAFSVTLWFYASVAEVYTLNLALLAIIIYLMLRWYRISSKLSRELNPRSLKTREGDAEASTAGSGSGAKSLEQWPIFAAAATYGLALGVHHVTILLTLPAFALLVWRTAGKEFFMSRNFALAFLFALAGVAVYLYLPLAAARQPVLSWGSPVNLQRFYWHISAKQYQVNLFSTSTEQFAQQFGYFIKLVFRQFSPIGLALSLIGLWALWRRERSICWLLLLIIFFDTAYSLVYDIAEDKDAYYLTTNLALAIAIVAGAGYLFLWATRRGKATTIAIVALIAALPIANFIGHYFENNKRNYLIARDFVDNTLRSVEPGGLLLTLEWQFYSPYLYLRHIEDYRRDVTVVDVNLLRRTWYIEGYLMREYPEMMAACAAEKAAFLEDLTLFEQGQPYDTARINQRFLGLINAFIKFNLARHGAYLTLPMEQGVGTDYNWVPQGLTMRLYPDKDFHPEAPELELRGLLDNSVYLDEVAKGKLLRLYATMLANRGRYLASAKQFDSALDYLRLSLQLDADFDRTYEFIGDIYAVQGNTADAIRSYQAALAINPGNNLAQQRLTALQSQKPPP